MAYDGNYRQIFHNSGANTAAQAGSCQTCDNTPPPTAVPTSTPTVTPLPATLVPTGQPTNTPTPTPSPLPATDTPVPTATPLPTDTPTPTPTPFPVINVKFFTSQPSSYLACNGGTEISVSLNNNTFCNTSVYTSSYFTSLGTTNYWLAYDGNYRQIFHTGSQNTATQGGSCQTCDNTLPATLVPTNTPTPEPEPPTPTPTPSTTPCPIEGTLLETYCSDFDLYGTYANGSCGSYNQLIESNFAECGYQEPTPTPTSVPPTVYTYEIGVDQSNRTNACNNFGGDPRTEVYTAEGNPANVLQFFTDPNFTYEFFGSGDVYCYARQDNLSNKYTSNINSMGMSISSREACP